ncbi:MAG TPA: glycosyltransferase [Acidimicrobiales bacterium]|nr:glycosyltransferase [Acidimicrobiales bacterium]
MKALEALAWLPAAIWVYLVLFRGLFWLPSLRLPPTVPLEEWPPVAVVVPARNEAAIIGETLPTLLAQQYPGRAEIFLVDDSSDDGTGEVAASLPRGDLPLQVVGGADRPPGWVGKTWALHQGVTAAESTDPQWILFTDADIAHPPDSLSSLVAAGVHGQRDLVSLMARLRTSTGWEKMIVPAFVYFFSKLYPFRQIARRRSRTAGAAGGCVLVRTEALVRAGGIPAIAGAVIDDVALGRAVKRSGGSTWLGYADRVRSVRPYPRLGDLWDMVARSAYTQLRYSPLALVGTVLGLAVIYLGPPAVTVAGVVTGGAAVMAAGATAWFLLTASYVPMVAYYGVGLQWALTLPVAATIYGAMTVDSARRHRRGAGAAWKGRSYSRV